MSDRFCAGETQLTLSTAARLRIFGAGLLAIVCIVAALAQNTALVRWQRELGFDLLQKVGPVNGAPSETAVAVIGERSLEALGPWPWPRRRLSALLHRVADAEPRAVVLAVLLEDADRYASEALRRDAPDLWSSPAVRAAIAASEDPDALIVSALARAPTAIATRLSNEDRSQALSTLEVAGGALSGIGFSGAATARPAIAAAASASGSINIFPDDDMLIRRMPIVFLVDGAPHPSLSVAALTAADLAPVLNVAQGAPRDLSFDGGQVPVEPRGDVWLDFGRRDEIPIVEAVDLMDGPSLDRDAAATLRNRFVVVGVNAAGVSTIHRGADRDLIDAPLAHAITLDALLTGTVLWRGETVPLLELSVTIVTGGLLAWLWAVRRPFVAATASVLLSGAWVAGVIAAKLASQALADPVTPFSGMIVIATICALVRGVEEEDRRRALLVWLAEGKQRVERDERARSIYLAKLSYEIRNPINAINGAAREISSRAIKSDLAGVFENVHRIEELSSQLRSVARQTLRAAELDATSPPVEQAKVDLQEVVYEAAQLARLAASKVHRDADLVPELVSAMVTVDRTELTNAVVSLISISIASGGLSGPIVYRCGPLDQQFAFFEIIDMGPIIDDILIEAVHTPLASRDIIRASPGFFGLGLFASKAAIERCHGSLKILTSKESGNRKFVRLPLSSSDEKFSVADRLD